MFYWVLASFNHDFMEFDVILGLKRGVSRPFQGVGSLFEAMSTAFLRPFTFLFAGHRLLRGLRGDALPGAEGRQGEPPGRPEPTAGRRELYPGRGLLEESRRAPLAAAAGAAGPLT